MYGSFMNICAVVFEEKCIKFLKKITLKENRRKLKFSKNAFFITISNACLIVNKEINEKFSQVKNYFV